MIDIFIVLTYVVITIAVGLFYGRKVKSIRDFSIADKAFPTVALVATIFASWMGGDDLIGITERIYSTGIIFLLVQWAQLISLAIHAYIIAPKILKDFEDKISIGEIMGELYGDVGKFITGTSNVLFSIGFIAVQVSAMGYVCNLFWGISHLYGTIVGSLIIIAYSAFGGIRSVVFTDILQFGVLIIAIPLMANFLFYDVGGLETLVAKLPEFHKTIDPSRKDFMFFVAMFVVCSFPYFNPILIQRMLMAKDAKQASDSLIISGLLFIPFYTALTIIALTAVLVFPNIDPNFAFLNSLNFSLPPVLKGFAIVGVLAVIMSTADSFLNVASISITRDIAVVLWPRISDRHQLLLARTAMVVLGLASIYIATCFNTMIDFWLYFSNFWTSTVVAPMIMYMLGIRLNIKYYVISVVIGLITIVIYRSIGSEEFNIISQLVGMVFTLISMFIFHKSGVGKIALINKKSN